jgi:hypothetical protein
MGNFFFILGLFVDFCCREDSLFVYSSYLFAQKFRKEIIPA